MQADDGQFEILTDPASFVNVMEALEKAGIPTLGGEVSMVPHAYVPVKDKAVAASLLKFIQELEDRDDVQNVYTNMDIPDELLKELRADE
jgi:transcriptional/translational regulatory protein YebC/TACO1